MVTVVVCLFICLFICLFVLGTLETFEAALERCSAQLQRIKERREKVCYLFLNTRSSSCLLLCFSLSGSREGGSAKG